MIAAFRERSPRGLLGVKLGARGALLETPSEGLIEVSAIDAPGPVLDTTGAGDSFMAGLIAGLENGLTVAAASRWASATGALAVTQRGGYAGVLSLAQVHKLLAQA